MRMRRLEENRLALLNAHMCTHTHTHTNVDLKKFKFKWSDIVAPHYVSPPSLFAHTHTLTYLHNYTNYACYYRYSNIQSLLRKSLSSTSGMSPDTALPQAHSLPSSVSDTLEAMVGGGLDDLTLEDIEPAGLADEPSEVQHVYILFVYMKF